jgi:hypothetical protein
VLKKVLATAAGLAMAGTLQFTVAISARAASWQSAGCVQTWVCLYKDKNWNEGSGSATEFDARNQTTANFLWNLNAGAGFNDQMSSWISLRSKYSKWYFDINGSGSSRCMKPNWYVAQVTSTENDRASSVLLYGDATRC